MVVTSRECSASKSHSAHENTDEVHTGLETGDKERGEEMSTSTGDRGVN